jgi:DNA-binding transcriptional ArsR family regulator
MGKAKASRYSGEDKKLMPRVRQAANLLKNVSDPTRLQVISMLSEGEMHVGAMCDALNLSQPALSHHLALLRHGGIIEPHRQGQRTYYGLGEKGETLARVIKDVVR